MNTLAAVAAAAFDGITPGLRRLVAVWAAAVAIALFVIAGSPRFAHIDFVAFSCAGHAVAQRDDPYRELPLQRCEHAVTSEGAFATSVTVPAPLPPFALLPFAALSWFEFPAAFALFTAASVLATAFGCWLCARLARVPALLVIALAAPIVWDNWMKGQPVPFAFLALTSAALLLAGGRDRWAAVAALGTLLQPQFGLAVCGGLFLWRPRARVPLALGAAVLAIACFAAVSPATLVDYARHVLPLQAASEARWASQLSLVNLLVVLGVPVARAMTIAAVQQAVTGAIGVLVAGYLARKSGATELVVVFPALCAAIGGTYLHVNALLVVLPAALVIARGTGGRGVYVALSAALLPWLALGEAIPIPAIIVSFAVFTIAFVLGIRWPLALLASAGCAVLALASRFVERDAPAIRGSIPVVGHAYAETSWAVFTAAMNPAEPVLRAALILKSATWLGLVALVVCAVWAARRQRPVVATPSLSFTIPEPGRLR
jgi:hypothetical protein